MTFELGLPRGLDAAAVARSALEGLDGRLPPDLLGDVRLLVSELVTKAVRHAPQGPGADVRLTVTVTQDVVRVEVVDPGGGLAPGAPAAGPEPAGGWGLFLVETLADRWGGDGATGRRVWFELDGAGGAG